MASSSACWRQSAATPPFKPQRGFLGQHVAIPEEMHADVGDASASSRLPLSRRER
jgi:hypothetical protein